MPSLLVRAIVPSLLLLGTAGALPHVRDIVVIGRVTNAADATPLSGTSVALEGGQYGARTDSAGVYRLSIPRSALARDSVTLLARRIGFAPAKRVFAIADTVRADFALAASPSQLASVIVSGTAAVGYAARPVPATTGPASARTMDAQRSKLAREQQAAAYTGGAGARPDVRNTESYAVVEEADFVSARAKPLSTFSVDVDRASYSNIRRFVAQGVLPPVDAVRIEEMVNYFPYAYEEPSGRHPFSVTTDVARAPWNGEHALVRIGLQAKRVDLRHAPANNFVFLLDVSGSMAPPNKLPLVKQAMRLVVEQLRPQDRVAVVVYAGSAGLALPSTPGSEKSTILDAIERLGAGGSTAGGAGIKLAYRVAREQRLPEGNNRVILATDGDFNVGVSSDGEMVRLIEEERQHGIFLTVLGFGYGNLKDSKLEQIADKGNGNYAYIDDLLEARKTLVTEMGGTLVTVAKDVKLQVEFNPARVRAYRLIGYENRMLADEDFNDDARDAGEMGAGHSVTALYEVIPVGAKSGAAVREPDSLKYQTRGAVRSPGSDLLTVKLRYKEPEGAASRLLESVVHDRRSELKGEFAFATAVAEFGLLLRDSRHKGSASFEAVIARAERNLGDDEHHYRRDFVALVRRAAGMAVVAKR